MLFDRILALVRGPEHALRAQIVREWGSTPRTKRQSLALIRRFQPRARTVTKLGTKKYRARLLREGILRKTPAGHTIPA